MPKPQFNDAFTRLTQSEKDLAHRLAEIEESDRNMCAGCGGEDCQCCEIYLDRQKWVSPDELFADLRDDPMYADRFNRECDEDCPNCDLDDCPDRINMEDIDAAELEEPLAPSHDRTTPCDIRDDEGKTHCPFMHDDDNAVGMYFCRDHCGVGVDD